MSGLLPRRGGLAGGRRARRRLAFRAAVAARALAATVRAATVRAAALRAAAIGTVTARSARTARAARCAAHRGAEIDHLAALDLALVDPDLDAQRAVGREGRGRAVVDVRLQRRERHAAFALLGLARHLGVAQAAVELDLHALGAGLDRGLDRALDRAPEGHALL